MKRQSAKTQPRGKGPKFRPATARQNAKPRSENSADTVMKTVGLCMIVKDESQVILRCLRSVRPLIDYALIVNAVGDADRSTTGRGIFAAAQVRENPRRSPN